MDIFDFDLLLLRSFFGGMSMHTLVVLDLFFDAFLLLLAQLVAFVYCKRTACIVSNGMDG